MWQWDPVVAVQFSSPLEQLNLTWLEAGERRELAKREGLRKERGSRFKSCNWDWDWGIELRLLRLVVPLKLKVQMAWIAAAVSSFWERASSPATCPSHSCNKAGTPMHCISLSLYSTVCTESLLSLNSSGTCLARAPPPSRRTNCAQSELMLIYLMPIATSTYMLILSFFSLCALFCLYNSLHAYSL